MKYKPKLKVLDQSKPGIITAAFIIEVIDEGPFYAVFKDDSDHAESTFKYGMALLCNKAISPGVVSQVPDFVANFKI